ncbi:MAG: CGNR zinc finger domain-containing protein [Aphanocapsa sp. GSE-SYN-MK-11-07L]|jgi:predicted RNA-binding Zn ribbon-like protein|nr:CGNR zinc finger domain-containing protein [Aphanocapsa sp. GSE-SYN-MK-11-07L]
MGIELGHLQTLEPLGERLCLDFCNTVEREGEVIVQEWLTSYTNLVAWSQSTQILTAEQGDLLLQAATQQPAAAAEVFRTAIALRAALYEIFSAVAARQPVPSLATLNHQLVLALPHLQLQTAPAGFAWSWAEPGLALDQMLWPVTCSAAELLTSPDQSRIRECAAPDCGWLFLDLSRNRSRRWCDMETCGNRTKARRHYARSKQAQD